MTGARSDPVISVLAAAGLLQSPYAYLQPLTGGVSSDIWLVHDGANRFVVKRALDKLRVRDDWFADTTRNQVERRWLAYAAGVVPGSVPQLLKTPEGADWFAMEFIGGSAPTWKSQLLSGQADPATAQQAGEKLGRLHASSWGRTDLAGRFGTLESFTALRIEPYLLTTATRVPDLAPILRRLAVELAGNRLALVHGDYSPKNLLVAPDRLVILDAEVACFGDPAFDPAFLLTHLLLKAQRQAPAAGALLKLNTEFWRAYESSLQGQGDPDLEARTVRLTLALLLARVHGKSPVEYLRPGDGELITDFVRNNFPTPPASVDELTRRWADRLQSIAQP